MWLQVAQVVKVAQVLRMRKINASIIISFEEPEKLEKLEKPEQPEKPLYQQESLQVSLNVTVSPPPGENKRGGGTSGILCNEHITRTR